MLKRRIFIPATALCCSLLLAPALQALPLDAGGLFARLASLVSVLRQGSPAPVTRVAAPGKPRVASKNGCGIDPQGRPICGG
jgi:hypothetical protein